VCSAGVWPGVRWAGLPKAKPAAMPGMLPEIEREAIDAAAKVIFE
jgi:hypothetical protein